MKPTRLLALSLVTTLTASAQNTYPFPAAGNVGIGTTSPEYSLDVRGPASFVSSGSGSIGLRIVTPHSLNDANVTFNNESGATFAWLLSYRRYSDNGDFWIFNGSRWTADFTIKNAGGEVGIGTSNPRSKLQVLGPITAGFAGGSTSGIDYLYGLYGSGALFVLGSQYSSAASFLGYAVKAKPGAVGYLSSTEIPVGRSAIEASLGHISFLTGHTQTSTDGGSVDISERMRIDANGNVGIGTASPPSRLTIQGDSADWDTGQLLIHGASSAAKRLSLGFDTSNNFGFIQALIAGNNYYNLSLQPHGGNVGIGTTNPQHKLAVNGTIKAKEVIVETTGWSDYVLAKTYKLQSLSEVEAHINDNGHLPGIPSAAQVAEQGVSIGDMQAKLLAKIEELTLHQIAQEKLLKSQTELVAAQSDELAALRDEVRILRNQ
jgi:hypothetical protein